MKLIQVNIAATELLLFTPLPQIHMNNVLLDNKIVEKEQVLTLEYINSESLSKIFFEIAENKPTIVSFSVYMWNYKAVAQLSESIKNKFGNKCWVVWGGPHVSEDPLLFMKKNSNITDFLVTWYGERPIMDIAKSYIESSGDLKSAKEILIKKRSKGIYFSGEFQKNILLKKELEELFVKQKKQNNVNAEKESDIYNQFGGNGFGLRAGDFIPLAELPEAYQYDRLPKAVTDIIGQRIFNLESYRGCPFSCSYCLWGVASKKCDYLSADRMCREFENMVNFGARHFNLSDAGFGLKKQRDVTFLKHIIEIQSQTKHTINLTGYWFWQTLTDEMLEVMKEVIDRGIMGQIDVGIQTFNPEVTKVMKRPTDYEKFDDTVSRIQKHKIPFQMDLILGLPGDNFKGYLDSVKNIMRLQPDKFQTFPLSVLPGSDYDRRRKELGIVTMKGSRSMEIDSVIETASFPANEIQQALRVESYFYLTYTLRLINNTFKYISKITGTSFYDVSLGLYEKTKSPENIIFKLTDKYYKELYENRHLGRTFLDNFLFKNFDEVHLEIKKFISFYLKKHNKLESVKELNEILAFDLLIYPKIYSVIQNTKSFDQYIEDFDPNKKTLIATFNSKNVINIFFPKYQHNGKAYKVSFQEPVSNFREGGIATQYNFWKWKTSMKPKLAIARLV